MATITFDTLKFVETLEGAGMDRQQASAIAAAVRDSHVNADVATRGDVAAVRAEVVGVKAEVSGIKSEIAAIKWMFGFVGAGVLSLLIKAFF